MDSSHNPLLDAFVERLSSLSESFIGDINELLDAASREPQCAAIFLEYSYGSLNIFAYLVDKDGRQIGNNVRLPQATVTEPLFDENLLPVDPDELDDGEAEELDSDKSVCIENWIVECWKAAGATRLNVPHAYMAIHDSYFYTDLKNGSTINNDEIAKTLASGSEHR